MREEEKHELSLEDLAELKSATAGLEKIVRERLALGTSVELLKAAFLSIGFPKEDVERIFEAISNRLKREAAVDRDLEVANTLTQLEMLRISAMRDEKYGTALEAIRERIRFTGSARFVKYTSSEPSRTPSEFEKSLEEIGGMERERIRMEVEKRVITRAKEMRDKAAAKNVQDVENEKPRNRP